MVATTAAVMTIVPNLGMDDVYLAYLPLAHVFELAAEVIYFVIHILPLSRKECNSGYVPGQRCIARIAFFLGWRDYMHFTGAIAIFDDMMLSRLSCWLLVLLLDMVQL
jgi:hypothetical protein